jgi:transcriptional regulator with XRE-family HTH domain
MGFLSVIRRWALRDKMPIREIARRTGLSRNTIKKYLREGAVEPKFKTPPRPSKLDPYADRLSAWLLAQTRKSRKERRTVKQMHADLVKLGYDGSYGRVAAFARAGAQIGTGRNRRRGAAPMCRWCSSPAKRSSSTGARTGPISAASASSCRSPISSCRTAGRSWCGPICCKPTRCCSTPTGMPSASSAAFLAAGSTTI